MEVVPSKDKEEIPSNQVSQMRLHTLMEAFQEVHQGAHQRAHLGTHQEAQVTQGIQEDRVDQMGGGGSLHQGAHKIKMTPMGKGDTHQIGVYQGNQDVHIGRHPPLIEIGGRNGV